MPLPRYARRPLRQQGTGTVRKRPVRQLVYREVSRRARGRCEMCNDPYEVRTGLPLDPHHAYGRSHLIPAVFAESPETVFGVCRRCHDRIHGGDQELADCARRKALERFCARHQLDLGALMEEAGPDLVDVMRAAIRRLEEWV